MKISIPSGAKLRPIQKARLLAIADRIEEEDASCRFYFGRWVSSNWEGKRDLSCGTTACALGWATTIPALQRQGLRLFRRRGFIYPALKGHKLSGPDNGDREFKATLKATRRLFGLNARQTAYLFLPRDYTTDDDGIRLSIRATSEEVATRIRKFAGVLPQSDLTEKGNG